MDVLIEDLQVIASQWKSLGIQLGLSEKLGAIEGEESRVVTCFENVLKEWLNSDFECTKKKLLTVLRTTVIGNNRLASEIEEDEGIQLSP